MLVALINVAVRRSSGKGPWSFSLTRVSARRFWCVWQFCSRCCSDIWDVTGAHCRMTRMELGEHVMSESAETCPWPHNGHLVFSREEVVCNMCAESIFSSASFTMVFVYSEGILYRSCGSFLPSDASLSASVFPEVLQWDGIYWMTVHSVDCCSVASDETSVSISLFFGFCSACKTD